VEGEAAWNRYRPTVIVEIIRREAKPGTDFSQVVTDIEARITELSEAAKSRPDHARLNRGIETMRKVAELLNPSGAEVELQDLAEKIRVCATKSDNYARTAGQHLRAARERCRAIGLDFNKWCVQANLGIKRSRIYQLMGPDPITTERRAENHSDAPENVQSVDVPQLTSVELISEPQPEPPVLPAPEPANVNIGHAIVEPQDQSVSVAPQFRLRDLPFDDALASFKTWYAGLTVAEQKQVEAAMGDVEAEQRTAA
jgi:hypothetical protein